MTPDNIKRIKEAAERVNAIINGWHDDRSYKNLPAGPKEVLKAWRDDLHSLATFALDQIAKGEDGGGEQIDTAWLKDNWYWNDYGTMTLRAKTATAGLEITWNSDDGFSFCTHASGMSVYTNPLVVTTRHQFRQLAQALNLAQKRKEAE